MRFVKRSGEFIAGLTIGGALLSMLLWIVGPAFSQSIFGPVRDYVGMATSGHGQRDVSIDMSTSPPRFEIGRTVVNGLRFSGGATGVTPVITAAISGADAGAGLSIDPGTSGYITLGGTHITGHKFFNAIPFCTDTTTSTAAVAVRVAANDLGLRRTATAAETHNFTCFLDLAGARTIASKGIRFDSLDYVFQNTIAALTTHTVTALADTTYADSTANDVNGMTVSGTLAVTSQALPQVAGLTVSSPTWHTTQLSGLTLETQVVLTTNGVFTLYGINVRYSTAYY